MSDLIAIAYPDQETAARVRETLVRLQREHLITLDDAVVVRSNADGKVKLDQALNLTGAGAASGALWGSLIGLLFFAPLLGAAVGAAGGALGGSMTDYGIDDQFMKDLGRQLQPNTSALFLLVRDVTPDKVLDQVAQYGGTVLRTSLSHEDEARLQSALDVQGDTAV